MCGKVGLTGSAGLRPGIAAGRFKRKVQRRMAARRVPGPVIFIEFHILVSLYLPCVFVCPSQCFGVGESGRAGMRIARECGGVRSRVNGQEGNDAADR